MPTGAQRAGRTMANRQHRVEDPGRGLRALRRGWHVVAASDDVGAQPMQAWLLGEPWVLWRAADGSVRAFVDRCPHRLAPLSAGRACEPGLIECGYHGWRFDGEGRCTSIPALGANATIPPRAQLVPPAAVAERGGLVWIAPDRPVGVLLPVDPPPGAARGALVPTRAAVDPGSMIDNFLDAGHFPFVHAGTFGSAGSAAVDEYVVRPTEHGFVASTQHEFANHEDPAVARGERPLVQRRTMTYAYEPPYAATLRLDHLDTGSSTLILFAVQPERDGEARMHTVLWRLDPALDGRDADAAAAMAEAVAFEQAVLEEDLVIQRQMRTTMPLDITVEVHTRADRVTVELRRALARFVALATAAG